MLIPLKGDKNEIWATPIIGITHIIDIRIGLNTYSIEDEIYILQVVLQSKA